MTSYKSKYEETKELYSVLQTQSGGRMFTWDVTFIGEKNSILSSLIRAIHLESSVGNFSSSTNDSLLASGSELLAKINNGDYTDVYKHLTTINNHAHTNDMYVKTLSNIPVFQVQNNDIKYSIVTEMIQEKFKALKNTFSMLSNYFTKEEIKKTDDIGKPFDYLAVKDMKDKEIYDLLSKEAKETFAK